MKNIYFYNNNIIIIVLGVLILVLFVKIFIIFIGNYISSEELPTITPNLTDIEITNDKISDDIASDDDINYYSNEQTEKYEDDGLPSYSDVFSNK